MSASYSTDVLIIGSGGAGLYAALAAARAGSSVWVADRGLIGRAGATIMAQMTVAAAVGDECPDHWEHHLADTLRAGRGLCDPALARLLCEQGPLRIREMEQWKVGWARRDGGTEGPLKQVMAPGHDRPRCVYVDFLNTGPAVSRTLRTQVHKVPGIRRVGDLLISDLVVDSGQVTGAVGVHLATGEPVTIAAHAVIISTGGLTRLYRRNSASANMGGDGYALALRAGAELIDMEFVQFFPIGHLAPRLIGMDPIMWDPFRYKLGGRLTNGLGQEFSDRYGQAESGQYVLTRDVATWAITQEVAAGRGSPSGGAWLSFRHIPEAQLRAAFGPVIERLAKNGIDLTQQDIEVAPIAHYHMGGVRVDDAMRTGVAGLFAAGEAVGGANGANRLSGNAITEAFVFGEQAGRSAAAFALRQSSAPRMSAQAAAEPLDRVRASGPRRQDSAALIEQLQHTMSERVGPFRSEVGLLQAERDIAQLKQRLGDRPPASDPRYALERLDWFDLRNMIQVAEVVVASALRRRESRGAHQRVDFPGMLEDWAFNQVASLRSGALQLTPGQRADYPPTAASSEQGALAPTSFNVTEAAAQPARLDTAPDREPVRTARLEVLRAAGEDGPSLTTLDVPFKEGQSVLDGLRWARSHLDPSLSFRYSCINANACKECMMEIDGKVGYACTVRLVAGPMRLRPLANKALVRDLVSEIAPPEERLI